MNKKYYKIHKILNNNAVEIIDNGMEIIVIGNAIGFRNHVNDYIHIKDDYKTYTLQNNLLKTQFEALLNEIPFECIELTERIIDMAKNELKKNFNQGLLVSLSDHIHFAVKSCLKGYDNYGMVSEEIKRFYSDEYQVGKKAVKLINQHYDIKLNQKEASSIAFHLINAEYNHTVDKTTRILKSIDDILNIMKKTLEIELSEDSLYYSRLVIHLKFFMQRIIKGERENDDNFEKLLINQQSDMNQKIEMTIDAIAAYLLNEFDYEIYDSERFYLLVHIARII